MDAHPGRYLFSTAVVIFGWLPAHAIEPCTSKLGRPPIAPSLYLGARQDASVDEKSNILPDTTSRNRRSLYVGSPCKVPKATDSYSAHDDSPPSHLQRRRQLCMYVEVAPHAARGISNPLLSPLCPVPI